MCCIEDEPELCTCVLSHFSLVQFFATLWIVAQQAPLFMGFSKHKYWSGLPYPPSGDLRDLGGELASLKSPASAGRFFTASASREALALCTPTPN